MSNKWIKYKSKKPSFTGLYLVSVGELVTVLNFTGFNFETKTGVQIEPEAWQPLPNPYKEEKYRLSEYPLCMARNEALCEALKGDYCTYNEACPNKGRKRKIKGGATNAGN